MYESRCTTSVACGIGLLSSSKTPIMTSKTRSILSIFIEKCFCESFGNLRFFFFAVIHALRLRKQIFFLHSIMDSFSIWLVKMAFWNFCSFDLYLQKPLTNMFLTLCSSSNVFITFITLFKPFYKQKREHISTGCKICKLQILFEWLPWLLY